MKRAALLASVVTATWLAACTSDANATNGCLTTVPPGSFALSCGDCSMSGTVLECSHCSGDPTGASPVARIDTCSCPSVNSTNNIHNDQGVLKCGDDAPAGSSSSGSSGKPSCKGDGASCSSSTECCSGHCESSSKSSAYHECN